MFVLGQFLDRTKIAMTGPCRARRFEKRCNAFMLPPAAASSAYHTCVAGLQSIVAVSLHLFINGMTLTAYSAMDRGHPCVVPSSEDSSIPPVTNRREDVQ